MVVDPKFIQSWREDYDEDSPLWEKYGVLQAERAAIRNAAQKDEIIIRDMFFDNVKPPEGRDPIYLATGGPPLVGKSTIFETHLKEIGLWNNAVMSDPDAWCGFVAPHLRQELLSFGKIAGMSYEDAQKRAYDLMRPATNFITLPMINDGIEAGFDVVHGTTMTNPRSKQLMADIKAAGHNHRVGLCLVWASEALRMEAATHRSKKQGNCQTSAEDIKSKGDVFHERMPDYFAEADCLMLHWRHALLERGECGVVYDGGKKAVFNEKAMQSFIDQYNERLGRNDFKELEQAYQDRTQSHDNAPRLLFG